MYELKDKKLYERFLKRKFAIEIPQDVKTEIFKFIRRSLLTQKRRNTFTQADVVKAIRFFSGVTVTSKQVRDFFNDYKNFTKRKKVKTKDLSHRKRNHPIKERAKGRVRDEIKEILDKQLKDAKKRKT